MVVTGWTSGRRERRGDDEDDVDEDAGGEDHAGGDEYEKDDYDDEGGKSGELAQHWEVQVLEGYGKDVETAARIHEGSEQEVGIW